MRIGDWAIILATLVGPIVAVVITLWYQKRDNDYSRKIQIFRSLMQWRANWLHPDWVGALNMIPVEFSGCTEIISAFNGLIDKLNDRGFSDGGEHLGHAYQRAEAAFVELVQQIGARLRIDLTGVDLRSRVYAPRGWADEQASIQSLRSETLALLRGETAVKVEVGYTVPARAVAAQ
ncbi:DUF6680 family protein [Sphingobium bisphenolivorans]|uniref:DUF6680 family protein n=1 Tax=Sphingobium bisphenolivorans TaxID=1335760 RepID=UPI0003B39F66